MANLDEAYDISTNLELNLFDNEIIKHDLYKTLIVTEDEVKSVTSEFDPEIYIQEAKRFKNVIASKINLITLLKTDIDSEETKMATANDAKQTLEKKL